MSRAIACSPVAEERLARAAAWLGERGVSGELLVIGGSPDAAGALVQRVVAERGAAFGWHRHTLSRTAAAIAGRELAARGWAAAGRLALEALAARVVHRLARENSLGRFAAVADRPGLPRALLRTVEELRAARIEPARIAQTRADLAAVLAAYEEELADARLADRATIFGLARNARDSSLLGKPLLLLDVAIRTRVERELVAALAERSPNVLALVPAGDERSLANLEKALAVTRESISHDRDSSSLARLQQNLFSEGELAREPLDDAVHVLSAPGESRECVEIARMIQQEAARGVPFDRMAILLRSPMQFRAHVEEALRRAGVPAHFAEGTRRPDPAGRALLALLATAAEDLSARRFAEYLSLGEVPDATVEGAPPAAIPSAERWVPSDEELVPASLQPPTDEREPGDDQGAASDPESAPVIAGTLRTPRHWERLLVDAAVIGGRDRWSKRLDGLERERQLDLAVLDAADPHAERVRRDLAALANLRRYALPLLDALAALPGAATWAVWLEQLSSLASRALRRPERVLSLLAELAPMGSIGPVTLSDVRLVLERRLTDLVVHPSKRASGRIHVGPVEGARGLAFDVVFAPGLAERIFPQKISEDPVLRDEERARLDPDLPRNAERVDGERLALRIAVGAARKRLVLSYSRIDLDQSRPRVPSFYGLEALRAAEGRMPGFDELARRAEVSGAARIGWPAPRDPKLAIDDAEHDLALLHGLFQKSEEVGAARYLLGANPHLARALRFRARRWIRRWTPADGIVEPIAEARAALAAHRFTARSYSPTALQHFASCPYKFLLQAIHRFAPREDPAPIEEIDPLSRGSLVHEVLYRLLLRLREHKLLPVTPRNIDDARAELDRFLDESAAKFKEELVPAIDKVWDDCIASIRADLREWLRLSLDGSAWTPWRFELSFGPLPRGAGHDEASRKESVTVDRDLQLRGSIDLVEIDAQGALRATDYKTGKVRAEKDAVVGGGEILQPVLYALALEKLFPEKRIDSGRLYYCTSAGGFTERTVPLDQKAREAVSEVAATITQAIDNGFLPAAPQERACDFCDYNVVCGPYEELRTRKVKPQEQLAPLQKLRSLE
jgi:CRISPR/Cas system-associated exonuclease Cas4 (RecB family)